LAFSSSSSSFFGSSFLVAPVFNKEKYRYIYLPKGRWVDYWTKIIYEGEKIYKYYKLLPPLLWFKEAYLKMIKAFLYP